MEIRLLNSNVWVISWGFRISQHSFPRRGCYLKDWNHMVKDFTELIKFAVERRNFVLLANVDSVRKLFLLVFAPIIRNMK